MAGESLFSSIQFSLDLWLIIYEELCTSSKDATGEKLEKIHFAKKAIRHHILTVADGLAGIK